ncbi:tyrosine-protein phosphatase Lar-like [Antedon mediterranea]|uniref:tyrosine-protein phosphatase Lar-like n=1 Tax=Antedon mediterranea TaxID=105859 RepID=UPI003AF76308
MLQYHIHFNLIKIDQCQSSDRNQSFTVKEPNLDLLRLESYSTYHVTISGESAAGIGPQTTTVEIITPPKDATASPSNVTIKNSTNPRALMFSWQEIPCGERRGVIQSYNYALRNNSSVVEQDVVNTMSVTITHLIPCTSYTFTVSGRGSGRQGPNSENITVVTAAEVPERVANIRVNETNLVWDAPSPLTCEMLQYHIHLNLIKIDQCQSSDRNQSFTVKEPNLDLLHMEPYSTYHVTISAESAAGIGPQTTVEIITPPKDATASPANVTIKNSTNPRALMFSWQEIPCGERRGVIQSYNYTLRNNSSVVEQDVVNTMSVTITHLIPCTSYTFTVSGRGSGRQGPNSETISAITAAEVPERVANIVVNETNLVWDAPSPLTCEMLQYHIHLNLIKIDQCQPSDRNQSLTVKEPNLDLLRLEPFSTYHVTISAESAAGIGPQTSVEIMTPQQVPTRGPRVRITSVTADSVSVAWTEIECGYRNGFVQSYKLNVLSAEDTLIYFTEVERPGLNCSISYLTPFTQYFIYIFGLTSIGKGVTSELQIKTLESIPTVPRNVIIFNMTAFSFRLCWISPNPTNGIVIGYMINYITLDKRNRTYQLKYDTIEHHGANTRYWYTVDNLQANKHYAVQVAAFTSVGIGPMSLETKIYTKPDIVYVSVLYTNEQAVMLSLENELNPRGRNVTYYIKYRQLQKIFEPNGEIYFDWFPTILLNESPETYLLKYLEPATVYEIEIFVRTSAGEGEPVNFTVTTLAPAAKRKPKMTIVSRSDTTITVNLKTIDDYIYVRNYSILVEKKTGGKRQGIVDEFLLNYQENPNRYITASFARNNVPVEFIIGNGETYADYYNAPLTEGSSYYLTFFIEKHGYETEELSPTERGTFLKAETIITTDEQSPTKFGIIIGPSSLFVAAVVLILILVLVTLKRKRYCSFPVNQDFQLEPIKKEPSAPVNLG